MGRGEWCTDLHAVIARAELEAIAAEYKQIAGFDRGALNRRAT